MKRACKEIKRICKFYLEHFLIFIFTVVIVLIMLALQYYFSNIDAEFGLSLIPNFIADMVGILITSYIIAILLQRSEEKKSKKKVYKIIGTRYSGLVSSISERTIHLLTKEPFRTPGGTTQRELMEIVRGNLTTILEELEEYVPQDIVDRKVKRLNSFQAKKHLIRYEFVDYIDFCEFIKEKYEKELEKFISRYIAILPDDLRESLLHAETLFGAITFMPISAKSNLKHPYNYNNYIKYLREFIEELIFLIEYFKEFQE